MPAGGAAVGSNQELGIEGSCGWRKGGAARARVGWREFSWLAASSLMVCAGFVAGLFGEDAKLSRAVGALGARRTAGSESRDGSRNNCCRFCRCFQDEAERGRLLPDKTFDVYRRASAAPERGRAGAIACGQPSKRAAAAAGEAEAGLRGAHAARIPNAVSDLDRGLLGGILRGVSGLAMERAFAAISRMLPAMHLLTGIGLILAVSLRDPLRDTLEFSKFAWGVALGCVVLLLPSLRVFNYQRFSAWCYTPLFARFRAVRFADALRLGTRRQRRESEPRTVSAGGGHQDSAGVFPGRILRAQLGAAARSAREAPGAALAALDQSAAPLARAAGDVRGGVARWRCSSC